MRHPVSPTGVVTVSLGVAVFSPKGDESSSAGVAGLYRAADRALYEAKSGGRNAVRTAVMDSTPFPSGAEGLRRER
jgi:GGDEF domain-containing protein